jgi:SAM-dependent methyltransferase
MTFKDHFSGHASGYASFRPGYPAALFDFAASLAPGRALAWDCATGNGQAALGLAERFARVIATDASAEQLAQATPHPQIEYRQAPAEQSGLPDGAADLVTVATAVHWLDFDRFYAEARRVLAPGGALVVWSYNLPRVTPEISALVDRLSYQIVKTYWPPERRWVDEEYRHLPFPFAEVEVPQFWIEERWDFARLLAYIGTWSATQRYLKAHGEDPRDLLRDEMAAVWGDPERELEVRFPIMMRAGHPRGQML